MELADRPVLRSRAWLVAVVVLGVIALALGTVGVESRVVADALAVTAAVTSVLVVVWARLRSRRQRLAFEDDLTAWAAERAAQAERLRIARDLHDLASHGLGSITVRAAATRRLDGPDAAAERIAALADIERVGREATIELRRMLSVLRDPGDEAPLRSAETLGDLPRIAAEARRGGVQATVDVAPVGEPSAGVQLTVCAVAREALANTARHAGPVAARVTVHRDGEAIVTTVTDDGPAPDWIPHSGAGTGLAGLRERVVALGGSLHADRAGRGYRVTARLPEQQGA